METVQILIPIMVLAALGLAMLVGVLAAAVLAMLAVRQARD